MYRSMHIATHFCKQIIESIRSENGETSVTLSRTDNNNKINYNELTKIILRLKFQIIEMTAIVEFFSLKFSNHFNCNLKEAWAQ